ncbi:hypothetical protein [Mycobacterium kubicae]|nr:hypothetical protein [Mycobacterium kubicae]QNI05057.1 hypothetical protein GAN17_01120 [Mycobacterium kubicae]
MTTSSNPWGDERKRLAHQLQMRGPVLGRRQARRLCRRFARVGVDIPPRRLQHLAAGSPPADGELTDVNFALIATHINMEKRAARIKRLRRRGTLSLLFAGLVLVVLNFLFCIAYVFLNLAQQTAP